jgi:ABC-2 type transport system permease protein
LIQSIVLIGCALFFGLRVDLLGTMLLILLVILIGIAMASLSYRIGLVVREGGILAGIINTFVLPAMILSGIMLPVSFGPPVIQALARIDPFFYAVDASRALIGGRIGDPVVPTAFGLFAVLTVIALGIFIRGMREAVA